MSSRPQFNPYPVMSAASMGADIISSVTIVQKLSMISYSATWSGSSPVGTLAVEISNDYSKNAQGVVSNAGNWTVLTSSAVSGNSGTIFFDVVQTAGFAIRLHYTRTSGSGSITATINAKVA